MTHNHTNAYDLNFHVVEIYDRYETGLQAVDFYSTYDGMPYTGASPRAIFWARRS